MNRKDTESIGTEHEEQAKAVQTEAQSDEASSSKPRKESDCRDHCMHCGSHCIYLNKQEDSK